MMGFARQSEGSVYNRSCKIIALQPGKKGRTFKRKSSARKVTVKKLVYKVACRERRKPSTVI